MPQPETLRTVTIKHGEAVLPKDVQEPLSEPDTYLVTYRDTPDADPAHAYQRDEGTWVLRSEDDGKVSWQLNRLQMADPEPGEPAQ